VVPEVWEVLDKIKAFADKVLRSGGGRREERGLPGRGLYIAGAGPWGLSWFEGRTAWGWAVLGSGSARQQRCKANKA
jgi:hypothetical protein